MQFGFGTGVLWGTPLSDATGATIANPTPVQLGVLQDVSLDISWDIKELFGQSQFPVAVGRGKGKLTGKAKNAQISGVALDSLVFGQGYTAGSVTADYYDVQGSTIPTTPFTVTVVPPNSGTFAADLGVRDSNGQPMKRVASAPTTGQYSLAGAVYTFAAADTGKQVFISYQYNAPLAGAAKGTVKNVLLGQAPVFKADFFMNYGGDTLILTLPNCVVSKFAIATKQDDFLVPELDFSGFADSAGNVMYWSTSEA